MEQFRNHCINLYNLDPICYLTSASYSYDSMLKYTQINLEMVQDYDIILFLESSIRGGLSQASTRYAKANNPYMGVQNYDSTKPNSYIIYLDINNLYGSAMRCKQPVGEFQWIDECYFDEIKQFILNKRGKSIVTDGIEDLDYVGDDEYGYILEVTLEYGQHLHDVHRDLPLLPHRYTPKNSKHSKLMVTLFDRKNYVIHYGLLIQCLAMGLKLTKIHKVLKFKQSHFLRQYVDLNTSMRIKAKTAFERDLYKNLVNVIYGKSIQDIRKYRNIKLVTKWDGAKGAGALISQPNFHSHNIQ